MLFVQSKQQLFAINRHEPEKKKKVKIDDIQGATIELSRKDE